MRETQSDIQQLQDLLDASYRRAGAHLASIHTPEVRISAGQLVQRLGGMHVFVVATSTSDGRPRTGPVDTFMYRGLLRFGTSPTAMRARHLRRSAAVSATYVQGERLVVTAHGNARAMDLESADADFDDFLRDHYGIAHYEQFLAGGPYYAIEPEWLFAADMGAHPATSEA